MYILFSFVRWVRLEVVCFTTMTEFLSRRSCNRSGMIFRLMFRKNFFDWSSHKLLGQLFLNVRIIFYFVPDVRHDNNDLHFSDWSIWLWWPIEFVSQKKLIFLFVSVKSSSLRFVHYAGQWWIDLPDPVLWIASKWQNYKNDIFSVFT